jgi:hypothetical protein
MSKHGAGDRRLKEHFMAQAKKAGQEAKPKAQTDRRRFAYLKIRYQELKNEVQAVKKEMTELRAKVGATKKPGTKGAGDKD